MHRLKDEEEFEQLVELLAFAALPLRCGYGRLRLTSMTHAAAALRRSVDLLFSVHDLLFDSLASMSHRSSRTVTIWSSPGRNWACTAASLKMLSIDLLA